MKPTVFGFLAVNDGKLVKRLEEGGRKIRSFIERESAKTGNVA